MKKSTSILSFSQNSIDALVIKGGKSFMSNNICFLYSLTTILNKPSFLEVELVISDDSTVKSTVCGGQLKKP